MHKGVEFGLSNYGRGKMSLRHSKEQGINVASTFNITTKFHMFKPK